MIILVDFSKIITVLQVNLWHSFKAISTKCGRSTASFVASSCTRVFRSWNGRSQSSPKAAKCATAQQHAATSSLSRFEIEWNTIQTKVSERVSSNLNCVTLWKLSFYFELSSILFKTQEKHNTKGLDKWAEWRNRWRRRTRGSGSIHARRNRQESDEEAKETPWRRLSRRTPTMAHNQDFGSCVRHTQTGIWLLAQEFEAGRGKPLRSGPVRLAPARVQTWRVQCAWTGAHRRCSRRRQENHMGARPIRAFGVTDGHPTAESQGQSTAS